MKRPVFKLLRPIRVAAIVLVALVGAELFLPVGCIGIQAMVGKKYVQDVRAVRSQSNAPAAYPPQMGIIRTTTDALQLWGQPRKRKIYPADHREVWRYRGRMKWRGALIWAVLPVPLLVPTGRHRIWLEFRQDSLTRLTTQCDIDRGFGIGLEGPFNHKASGDHCQ